MAGQTIQVPAELLQGVVSLLEKSSQLFDQVQRDEEAVKEAAPVAVEALLKQGLISEEQKAAAYESLSGSHAKALTALKRTASHVAPPSMGTPASMSKAANEDKRSSVSEADLAFQRALGF